MPNLRERLEKFRLSIFLQSQTQSSGEQCQSVFTVVNKTVTVAESARVQLGRYRETMRPAGLLDAKAHKYIKDAHIFMLMHMHTRTQCFLLCKKSRREGKLRVTHYQVLNNF